MCQMKSGQIIDARFVSAPVQRNTLSAVTPAQAGREENAVIKEGAVLLEWGKTPNKLAHKDVDARWTKKGVRSLGLARAKVGVALMNLAYNLRRVEWLIRSKVLRSRG